MGNLLCRDALVRIHNQHVADEVLRLSGNLVPVTIIELKFAWMGFKWKSEMIVSFGPFMMSSNSTASLSS
jgi:hypothetical protein